MLNGQKVIAEVERSLADERRAGEGMTEFTMRRIRNGIIEQCARAVEAEAVGQEGVPISDATDVSYNFAIEHAAAAIRKLKQ